MTLPEFALRYKDCTTEELIQFLRQRTGNLRRNCNRRKCIKKLKELDREVTFRFLDMAPELRNNVYELLLHHNNEYAMIRRFTNVARLRNYTPAEPSKAYPALLQTCRKIHKEASGVLYDQSVVFHSIIWKASSDREQLFDFYWGPRGVHVWPGRITTCRPHMLQVRRLTLVVDLYKHKMVNLAEHALPALMKAFGSENPLTTLKLVCDLRSLTVVKRIRDYHPEWYLYRLCQLPAATHLQLVGFPAAMEKSIRVVVNRPLQ